MEQLLTIYNKGVNMEEQLLTSRELCEKLKISKVTLSRWVNGEGLPAFSRKPMRFLWSEVSVWLKNRR